MHAKTLQWMERIGDKGWPYQTIIETVFDTKEQEIQKKGGRVRTGVLKGKPIEFLSRKYP